MASILTGTELARPFVPTQDFELSKRFYEALGFEKTLDGEVATFDCGSGGFILQRYYQKDWAENFMMQLMVDDLDAWWAHLQSLDLAGNFGVQPPRPPEMHRGASASATSSTRAACYGTYASEPDLATNRYVISI